MIKKHSLKIVAKTLITIHHFSLFSSPTQIKFIQLAICRVWNPLTLNIITYKILHPSIPWQLQYCTHWSDDSCNLIYCAAPIKAALYKTKAAFYTQKNVALMAFQILEVSNLVRPNAKVLRFLFHQHVYIKLSCEISTGNGPEKLYIECLAMLPYCLNFFHFLLSCSHKFYFIYILYFKST